MSRGDPYDEKLRELFRDVGLPLDAAHGDLVIAFGRAAAVMDPRAVAEWMKTPIAALNGDRPVDRLARGDSASVFRVLARLENDGFT